jgi:hypothetical protein
VVRVGGQLVFVFAVAVIVVIGALASLTLFAGNLLLLELSAFRARELRFLCYPAFPLFVVFIFIF